MKPASLTSEDHAAVDAAVIAADAVISQRGLQDTQEGQELTDNAWDSQPFDSHDSQPLDSRFNTSGFDAVDTSARTSRQEEKRRLRLGGLKSQNDDNVSISSVSHYGSDTNLPERVRPQDIQPVARPRRPASGKPLPPLPDALTVNIPKGQSDIVTLSLLMNRNSERMMNTILQAIGKDKSQRGLNNSTESKPERSFKAEELGVFFPDRDTAEESVRMSVGSDTTVYTPIMLWELQIRAVADTAGSRVVCRHLGSGLRGEASEWWLSETTTQGTVPGGNRIRSRTAYQTLPPFDGRGH
jgi:hypothetical protein